MRSATQRLAMVVAAANIPTVPKCLNGSPAAPSTIRPAAMVPRPLATCCTDEFTDMKLPRRRGSMLAVISDIAVTMRPALAAISTAATGAAPAIPTAGRCVSTRIITADRTYFAWL